MSENSENTPQDGYESPDQRMQRRRARRWKRRARIVGPFLAVPVLFATLSLSVDLIEYQPEPPKDRLSDRPIPKEVTDKQRSREARTRAEFSNSAVISSMPSAIATANPVAPLGADDSKLDLRLEGDETTGQGIGARYAAPTPSRPPYTRR